MCVTLTAVVCQNPVARVGGYAMLLMWGQALAGQLLLTLGLASNAMVDNWGYRRGCAGLRAGTATS